MEQSRIKADIILKWATIALFFFALLIYSQSNAQQLISFPDANFRNELLTQFGEGTRGVNNGAVPVGTNQIDFTRLNIISNPANSGLNAITDLSLESYLVVNAITDITGVELFPNLKYLKVSGFFGIKIPAGIVNLPLISLFLESNSYSSPLPTDFSGLISLKTFGFSGNGASSLPILPSSITSLDASFNILASLPVLPAGIIDIDVSHNYLTFEDLEPISSLLILPERYDNQGNFTITPAAVNLAAGQALNITAAGFIGGANNQYQWFKDGSAVSGVSQNPSFARSVVIPGDAATYTCVVTNTTVSDLSITSNEIQISVIPDAPSASDELWGMASRTGTINDGSIFKLNAATNQVDLVKAFNDGSYPHGDIIQATDGYLYGMTTYGGANNYGSIFRLKKDGSEFQTLYSFDSTISGFPQGSLVEASDGNLYGMTERGAGANVSFKGTVFKIEKGLVPNFQKLYEFNFGSGPSGNLIEATDGDLYGMTKYGAEDGGNMGCIFKIRTNGEGYKVLHQFTPGADGHQPFGSLLQATNGKLYGLTSVGGENNQGDGGGTLFSINTNGTEFQRLYGMGDGPRGNLIQLASGELVGTTQGGSYQSKGSIFKTDLNGTRLNIIHEFDEPNGAYPTGSLTEGSNGELYGTTTGGGSNFKGTLFKLNPDGSNFVKLYDFAANDFNTPQATLVLLGKLNQAITLEQPTIKKPTDPAFDLSVSSNSGLPITLTSSNEDVATIAGTTITLTGQEGTTNITASQAGNQDFKPAKDVVRILTVSKKSQVINFDVLAIKYISDPSFDLSATSDSELELQYTSTNAAVATISGKTVTINGIGTTVITAMQSGNADYKSAFIERTLTVSRKDQSITFNGLAPKKTGDGPFTLSAISDAGLVIKYSSLDDEISIIGSEVTILKPGYVTIAANQPGDATHNAAPTASQSFCIAPAKPVISSSFINPDTPVLTSNSSVGNQWFLGGIKINGATNQTFNVSQEGIYNLQVTIQTCASPLSDNSPVLITALMDADRILSLTAYPNPAKDYITLSVPISIVGNAAVTIYSSNGKRMVTGNNDLLNKAILIDSYPKGLYVASVIIGDMTFSKRFLKQ